MTGGSLQLCCTGGESLVRRRVCGIAQTTDGGLTRRLEGAVGLLHRKGSPVLMLKSKETRLMEGLSLRPKGAAALLHRRGESPFRLNARRGLTRRKKGSRYNRREPAALLHREWEPRPPPSAQHNLE